MQHGACQSSKQGLAQTCAWRPIHRTLRDKSRAPMVRAELEVLDAEFAALLRDQCEEGRPVRRPVRPAAVPETGHDHADLAPGQPIEHLIERVCMGVSGVAEMGPECRDDMVRVGVLCGFMGGGGQCRRGWSFTRHEQRNVLRRDGLTRKWRQGKKGCGWRRHSWGKCPEGQGCRWLEGRQQDLIGVGMGARHVSRVLSKKRRCNVNIPRLAPRWTFFSRSQPSSRAASTQPSHNSRPYTPKICVGGTAPDREAYTNSMAPGRRGRPVMCARDAPRRAGKRAKRRAVGRKRLGGGR